jgi:hypothetical protein
MDVVLSFAYGETKAWGGKVTHAKEHSQSATTPGQLCVSHQ